MSQVKTAHFSPGRVILLSIFCLIIFGTILLALPFSRTTDVSIIDLLFTATSATCVTGLFAVPMSSFTTLGHAIILLLIQIGGLGLITLTLAILYMFANVGFATQVRAGQLLEIESWKSVRSTLFFIIWITLLFELIGTLLLYTSFSKLYETSYAWFLALFYSISSFCSAGMPIEPTNMEAYQSSYTILITVTILMFVGGLGFITLQEIMHYMRSWRSKRRYSFSLHSKVNLYTTLFTIGISATLIWLLEGNHSFADMSSPMRFVTTIFHSLSFRSTGWITIPLSFMHLATIFLIMITTFIGSSPGSTGSGVKMTTVALFVSAIKAAIFGEKRVTIKGRSIPQDQVYKAMSIVSISLAWIVLTTFCLLITETSWEIQDMLFEVVSAFATLGLSTGNTATLSFIGKILIIATMIIGRIGSLTLVLALSHLAIKKKQEAPQILYPEERVMLS